MSQASEAHGGAQLKRFGLLLSDDIDGLQKIPRWFRLLL
jgi:hypothetical protein